MGQLVSKEVIEQKIYMLRDRKVMLDVDLAALYGVTVSRLNEQVRRNIERFPDHFMFQLAKEEFEALRESLPDGSLIFQFGISNKGRGGRRTRPFAFTEQGVANAFKRSPQ